MKIRLQKEWEIGEQIGQGGFGTVLEASSNDTPAAVAKLVPKAPGATREMLFVTLEHARNVIPVIDSGEFGDAWVLVMPRADRSLRQHIERAGPVLDTSGAVSILADIVTALVDLEGDVVHRDIKPENVLLLDGRWCLADFGIARYAEATTSPDTHKFSMSPPYAAPERWRSERATTATDVYAVGVIGHELLAGVRPFQGPGSEDFRHQHLHETPPPLGQLNAPLASLITECLYKPPGARPQPANLLPRLETSTALPTSPGLARLQTANQDEVTRLAESRRSASAATSEEERRRELFGVARQSLSTMSERVLSTIAEAAPAATVSRRGGSAWSVKLNNAELWFSEATSFPGPAGKIDVIANASIGVSMPPDIHGYRGRSHSLWYCDAQTQGKYAWFETAFMHTPPSEPIAASTPYAANPRDARGAVEPGLASMQVAWRFARLDDASMGDFVSRWADWLASAASGSLHLPTTVPEHDVVGSWRT